jgi:hypothetical protein
MSTEINIVIGGSDLRQRATEQTNANRFAKIESDSQKKALAKGRAERSKEQAKKGEDEAGKPTSSPMAPAKLRKDDPAANRFGKDLPFFYHRQIDSDTLEVMSGNGSVKVVLKLPQLPSEPTYEELTYDFPQATTPPPMPQPTINPETITVYIDDSNTYAALKELYAYQSTDNGVLFTGTWLDGGREMIGQSLLERIYCYRQRRVLSHSPVVIASFPLGGGSSLVVLARDYGRASYIREFVHHDTLLGSQWINPANTDSFLSSEINTLLDQHHTATVENPWYYQFDCVAAVVSYTSASVVQASGALAGAIRSLLPRQDIAYEYSNQSLLCRVNAQETSVLAASCIGFPGFAGFATPINTTTFNGNEVLTSNNTATLITVAAPIPEAYTDAPITSLVNSAYGLVTQFGRAPDLSCTPLSWAYLDGYDSAKDANAVTTHQGALGLAVSGTAVSQLFGASKLLGVPYNLTGTRPGNADAGTAKKYLEAALPNNITSQSDFNSASWRDSHKLRSRTALPAYDSSWSRAFIYDWGNPSFCRQQAAKYGL